MTLAIIQHLLAVYIIFIFGIVVEAVYKDRKDEFKDVDIVRWLHKRILIVSGILLIIFAIIGIITLVSMFKT